MFTEEHSSAYDQLSVRCEGSVDQVYDQLVPVRPTLWQTGDYHHLLAARDNLKKGDCSQDQEIRAGHVRGRGSRERLLANHQIVLVEKLQTGKP